MKTPSDFDKFTSEILDDSVTVGSDAEKFCALMENRNSGLLQSG